jgi:hypothetical protein
VINFASPFMAFPVTELREQNLARHISAKSVCLPELRPASWDVLQRPAIPYRENEALFQLIGTTYG